MRKIRKIIIIMGLMVLGICAVPTTVALADTTNTATSTEKNTTQVATENTQQSTIADYAESTLSPLTAKVVVLDPGHCATHPGAKGNGLREEVAVLDITKACRDYLKSYGNVTVYMTREDGSCCRDLELGDCLIARNNYAKILDADFLVSMHLNAGYTNGANVLSAYRSGYHDEIRVETQKFGKIALKELKALGIANRGLLLRKSENGTRYEDGSLADYYSIVRNGVKQQIPSVIIEHGYISSSSDVSKFFKTSAKRKKVGKADGKAIVSYYGLEKSNILGTFKSQDGATYYVDANNKKVTGWVKEDEKWYYFDPETAKMQTSFLEYQGETLFLSPATGEMVVGWFEVDGVTYLAKGNGAIVKNGLYSDGIYTYLFNDSGKQLKKGFHTLNGVTYYVNKKRHVVSGVVKINGSYYGFDTKTKEKLYGYHKVNGKYYYFDETTGVAASKTMKIVNGKQYYFGNKGARVSGWVTYKGGKYYFKKNGIMTTGWKKIEGKYYFFSKTTGKMQRSKWIGKYYVNAKGVRTKKR
ncbi:MAG: N-acetylmuramoyl-L-alanine amidase [Lachnospiraceae bacterium]|nr:N-acetylmuramoyl-L-alanine amidase [Lachnospiraceae bacterium]